MSFIKENAALVVALLLPVLFAGFFYVSKNVGKDLSEPPKHDFVVTDSRSNNSFDIEVIDGELVVKFIYPTRNDKGVIRGNTNKPQIFYIDAETLVAEPLNFSLPDDARNPPEEKEGQAVSIDLGKTKDLTFSAASISPDGFTFERGDHSGGNLMTEIYTTRGKNRNRWALYKDGAAFGIDGMDNYYFQLVGWVVDSE